MGLGALLAVLDAGASGAASPDEEKCFWIWSRFVMQTTPTKKPPDKTRIKIDCHTVKLDPLLSASLL